MLRDLHIRNLAVIEEASIEFAEGLNVVSGATGAGKSIVVDSVALLAGGRARADLIRAGAETLAVTGVFNSVETPARLLLDEAGIATDDPDVVIRREVSRENRNRVFVNDRPVTLRLLAELAPYLLRIHTQREELGLVSPELQRFWLDRSGGRPAQELLDEVRSRHEHWSELEARRQRLSGNERLRLERIDLLRFQRSEIDSAGLVEAEEETLKKTRDLLRHREAIQRVLGGGLSLLYESEDSAVSLIARSQGLLDEVLDWLPDAKEWQVEMEEARVRLDEVSRALRLQLDVEPADPAEIDAIESRLALIERLGRKYGAGTKRILQQYREIVDELDELESTEEDRATLDRDADEALAAYHDAAARLSEARSAWGAALIEAMHRELADLAMSGARLEVAIDRVRREESPLLVDGVPVEFSREGFDRVTFLLQANPGEQKRPVARVASGGELSRIYLALRLAAGSDSGAESPTLIFDEVDAGIGGSEAAALGRKLRTLSGGSQILAVTHLPQVASAGHCHFRLRKAVEGKRTRVEVERLGTEERVDEIARMLSGDSVTKTSRTHARDLLVSAEAGA